MNCFFCQSLIKTRETNAFWHYCDHHPLANQSSTRIIFNNQICSLHLNTHYIYYDEMEINVYLRQPLQNQVIELIPIYSETNLTPPSYQYLLNLLNRITKMRAFL